MGELKQWPYESPACIVCQKPLGQESRDMQYLVCHEHRKCVKCGQDLFPREVSHCNDVLVEQFQERENRKLDETPDYTKDWRPIHPRCEAVERAAQNPDPTISIKQSEYEFLNLLRLTFLPDVNLNIETNESNSLMTAEKLIKDMTWDEKYYTLKKWEACVAVASLAVAPGRKEIKERIAEREKERAARAKKEALTSSRPTTTKADDIEEIKLAEFMRKCQTTSRDVAKKQWRLYEKSIEAFVSLGATRKMAEETVAADMIKQGIWKA